MTDVVNRLKEYSELENCELGEACQLLCALAAYEPYLGEEFFSHLMDEIRGQLHNFVAHSKIVETAEEQTIKVKRLEWDE